MPARRRLALLLAAALLPAIASAQGDVADRAEGIEATKAFEGVKEPVDIAFGPDGALYYAELTTGNLRVIPPGASGPDPEPVWTAPHVQAGGERGFVGLALDPDFSATRAFYVYYTANQSGEVRGHLSRVVDGLEERLYTVERVGLLHNSGRIAFTPEGYLLLSVGDGILDTAGPQASMHAHDEQDPNGKVLRLTKDGAPAPGNPWGNEVWTKGHRNVYGLAVAPDGTAIGTENGPERGDEINVLAAGNDYGWPTCVAICGKPEFVDPVVWWEDTVAPTGAIWHEGHFYFSAFNNGGIYRLLPPADGGQWTMERLVKFSSPRVLDIAGGPDGIYASSWDTIWRISGIPEGQTPPTPSSPSGVTPTSTRPGTPASPPPPADEDTPTPTTEESAPSADVRTPGLPAALVALVALAVALLRRR